MVVALSSTEAELYSMTDAGKAALYLRSLLEELGLLQQFLPTPIEADNRGARQLTNAQQPTKRTRHVHIKEFCILQWVEDDELIYKEVQAVQEMQVTC